jgi:hypothetical protein
VELFVALLVGLLVGVTVGEAMSPNTKFRSPWLRGCQLPPPSVEIISREFPPSEPDPSKVNPIRVVDEEDVKEEGST